MRQIKTVKAKTCNNCGSSNYHKVTESWDFEFETCSNIFEFVECNNCNCQDRPNKREQFEQWTDEHASCPHPCKELAQQFLESLIQSLRKKSISFSMMQTFVISEGFAESLLRYVSTVAVFHASTEANGPPGKTLFSGRLIV